ncbi:zincin, partial [Sistotremastrum suecicum HHB10207 ss-3]
WPNGSTLKIKFIGGSDVQHQKVKKFAAEWLNYAYLGFAYVTSGDADIRVAFDPHKGHKSLLGKSSASDQSTPSMNLAIGSTHADDADSRRHILHEFGHALGCIHEQSRPDAHIKWNKTAVYKYYGGPPNNWTHPQVDYNVFYQYEKPKVTTSSHWDAKSIMMYPVRKEWTTDGWSCPWNLDLSAEDKSFMASMYPSPATLTAETPSRPISKGSRQKIVVKGTKTSDVCVGITGIETAADAYNERPDKINFTMGYFTEGSKLDVEFYPYQDTYMFNASVSVIDLVKDLDFHNGIVDLDSPNSKKPTKVWVEFQTPYDEPPEVVTFIDCFQLEHQWVIKVWPESISRTGFWLCSQNADPANHHGLRATWISLPARRGAPRSGTFTGSPANGFKGHVEFKRRFRKPPLLFIALTELNADSTKFLRFRIEASKLTEYGFDWEVKSWWDSVNKVIGGSY